MSIVKVLVLLFIASFFSGLSIEAQAANSCPAGQYVSSQYINTRQTCTGIANIQITLPTSLIAANSCTAPATATMTNLATTSTFITAFATNPNAVTGWGSTGGLTVTMWPTSNMLNWSVCNSTGSGITPGAMTLNVGAK